MASFLLPNDGSGQVISFDLTLSESHGSTADVTEHPVEQGSNIADHIRPNPKTLNLEVYVTNSPTNDLNGRGSSGRQEFTLPVFEPPIAPTPGSLFRQIRGLIPTGRPRTVALRVLTFPDPFDRVKEIHTALTDLQDKKVSMSVVTSSMNYDDMVLVSIDKPTTETGGGTFTLALKQIKTVTTATVDAPKPKEKRGAPAQAKGAQSKKPVGGKDAAKTTSMAVKVLQAAGIITP